MAENSLVLEKERLAQELSIGYKYFGNLRKTEELYKKAKGEYSQKKIEINKRSCYPKYNSMADVIKNGKVVDITKLKALSVGKSIQIEQKKREEKSIEEKIEQIEHDIKKEKAKCVRQTIKVWIAVLIWVAILVFSIVFFTNVEFSQAVLKNLTGVVKVLAVIGVIVAFLADIVAIFFLLVKNGEILDFSKLILLNLRKNSFIKGKEQEKASLQKKKETLFDISMETILEKTPDTQLINLVQENDPDVYVKIEEIYNKDRKEYLEKSKELSNEKQQEKEKAYKPVKIANETLNYFKTDMLKEIRNYLTVIPLDYFNEEAITGMLYYYTNKRGDTIKELINLYENEKFKEKLLGSIQQNTRTMQSIGKVVVTQLQTISNKMNSLQTELKAMQNSLEEVSRSNLANAYSVLSVMQKQLETQQEQYRQYEETAKINSQLDSVYKNLTVAIDGEPVDVKIYG